MVIKVSGLTKRRQEGKLKKGFRRHFAGRAEMTADKVTVVAESGGGGSAQLWDRDKKQSLLSKGHAPGGKWQSLSLSTSISCIISACNAEN